jgi:hypothetical protein
MGSFRSRDEFQRVFDRLFEALSRDPEIGPRLRAAKSPQRYVFPDLGVTLDVRDADAKKAAKGDNLTWIWNEKKLRAKPDVVLSMESDVANRFFQGRENVPLALVKKTIVVTEGDVNKALDLLPILRPFHARWVARLKADGMSHLVA